MGMRDQFLPAGIGRSLGRPEQPSIEDGERAINADVPQVKLSPDSVALVLIPEEATPRPINADVPIEPQA